MKLLLAVLIFFWLGAGLVGAWRLDELDVQHWQKIAKGPITLAEALNEDPVTYPGPD